MATVASPPRTYAGERSPRTRGRLTAAVHAMAGHVEDALQVTASRFSVPMVLLLFVLGGAVGVLGTAASGIWWASRLSFRVEQLELAADSQRTGLAEVRKTHTDDNWLFEQRWANLRVWLAERHLGDINVLLKRDGTRLRSTPDKDEE